MVITWVNQHRDDCIWEGEVEDENLCVLNSFKNKQQTPNIYENKEQASFAKERLEDSPFTIKLKTSGVEKRLQIVCL